MKRLLAIAPAITIFFACNSDQQQEAEPPVAVRDSMVRQIEVPRRLSSRIDTLRITPDTIITRTENEYIDTLLRFRTRMYEGKFLVRENYLVKPSQLDFSTYPPARKFRTTIRWSVKEWEMNFAGHYILATWGCGVPCSESAVVDLRTGKVYEGAPAACYGYTTSPQSTIIILNPPDDDGEWYDKNRFCGPPEEYVWTGTKLAKLESK